MDRFAVPRWVFLVTVACLGLLLTACDASEEGDGDRFATLLEYLPDHAGWHESVSFVDMADLQRLGAERGVSAPGVNPSAEEERSYLDELMAGEPTPSAGFLGHRLGMPDAERASAQLRRTLGIGPSDAHAWAVTVEPGDSTFAMIGEMDEARSLDVLSECPDCPSPERASQGGRTVIDWGEPAGVLVPGDGYLLRTPSREAMEQQLDAISEGATLAAVERYRLLAAELDRLEAVSVRLASFTQSPALAAEVVALRGDEVPDAVARAFEPGMLPTLLPYEAMGSGWGLDGGEPVTRVVLAHGSDEAAEENAGRIEERFEAFVEADLFAALTDALLQADSYGAIEVEVRGPLVVATLQGGERAPFVNPVENPLFLHE